MGRTGSAEWVSTSSAVFALRTAIAQRGRLIHTVQTVHQHTVHTDVDQLGSGARSWYHLG